MRSLLTVFAAALPAHAAGEDAWTLFQGLARSRVVEVVCAGDELRAAARRAIDRAGEAGADGHELRLVAPEDSDDARPRIALGSLAEPWMLALADKAGFAGEAGDGTPRIKISSTVYTRGDEVLVATVPDPERAGLPLTLYLSAEPGQVAAQLEELRPFSRPGAVVRARGALLLELPYRGGTPDWNASVDLLARRRDFEKAGVIAVDGAILHLQQGVDAERAKDYGETLSDVRRRALKALGGAELEPLDVRLLGSVQELLSLRGVEELGHAPPAAPGEVVALLAERLPHDGGAAAARATALALLGLPAADWLLDGAGAAFADTWWGKRKPEWIVHLWTAGLAPPLAELVAPDAARRLSPHVIVPLRGELFAHLVAERGAGAVAALWRGEEELAVDAELERNFGARLEALSALLGPRVESERRRRAELVPDVGWRDGVCFVPRGDPAQAFGGDVRRSLAGARDAGAGAIALMPFAYLDARPRLFAGLPPRPAPDASPGDLALASAVLEARALGLRVMLAPQILATPGGTWSDSASIGGEPVIDAFFADYGRALEHYALLGELLGVDVLCLGSERGLVSSTRAFPGDEEAMLERYELLLARWRELIADMRRLFSGRLTYAAEGMLGEVRRVAFWEELDFVGVNLFVPVARPNAESTRHSARQDLASRLESCLAEAERAGRPLLITQIGYPSHACAHETPLTAGGTADVELQAELFELMADVLRDARAGGNLAGVFLWRWDPDPDAGGAGDPSHTPQGKPAEALLQSLFAR